MRLMKQSINWFIFVSNYNLILQQIWNSHQLFLSIKPHILSFKAVRAFLGYLVFISAILRKVLILLVHLGSNPCPVIYGFSL
jgi:hypothetical protein